MRVAPDPVACFYEAINARDFSLLDWSLAAEWIDHQPEKTGNKAGFIVTVRSVLEAFPDLAIRIEDRIDAPSYATLRLMITGTHKRDFLGVRACGRAMSIRSHDIHRIEHGRIAESWQLEDWFAAFEQIGGLDVRSFGVDPGS